MKRLLAVALTAVPFELGSHAGGSRAAPPYIPDGVSEWCRRYCWRFTINLVMKNTTTASVNRILSASGSRSVTVTTSEGDVRTHVTAAFDGI